MNRPGFTVIDGEKDKRTFACPYCASTFLNRTGPDSLDEHWEADPRCKANARVNNPTQSKYLDAPDDEPSAE